MSFSSQSLIPEVSASPGPGSVGSSVLEAGRNREPCKLLMSGLDPCFPTVEVDPCSKYSLNFEYFLVYFLSGPILSSSILLCDAAPAELTRDKKPAPSGGWLVFAHAYVYCSNVNLCLLYESESFSAPVRFGLVTVFQSTSLCRVLKSKEFLRQLRGW